jgi:hypothetical protein
VRGWGGFSTYFGKKGGNKGEAYPSLSSHPGVLAPGVESAKLIANASEASHSKPAMKKLILLTALAALCGGCATIHRWGFFNEDTSRYVEVNHFVSPQGFEYDWQTPVNLPEGTTVQAVIVPPPQ